MKNKFLTIVLMLVVCLFTLVNVSADTKQNSVLDINSFSEVFKLSEQGEKIDLPFINIFSASATYDDIVKHSGISLGSSTIDVNEKLEGVQTIISNDMVTIKGEIEHAIIFANNVVIEGKITGDTLIVSPSVKILKDALISRDVIIVSNDLELEGKVDGNVISVISNSAKISGTIAKDFRAIAANLDVENSDIKGNVYVKTDMDTTKLLEKYKDAKVEKLTTEKESDKSSKILNIVIKGIITVVVYTAITFFITKKDINIVSKAYAKFKDHTIYGIIGAFLYFMLLIILPIILILLGIVDLGIIAWPILILYLSIFLLSISISTLVVGMVIYEAIKTKVTKYKLVTIAAIFLVLYVITNIPFISYYAVVAINLVSLAIIITMITRKEKVAVKADKK